jgi:alpha-glucosidase
VLSNHDLVRHPTRFGGGADGLRKGLAFTALLLALPGSAYLYQGEELGLEQSEVPPEVRQDPVWFRSGQPGRDGCRTPMPWTTEEPGFGFTTGTPWLPFDAQAPTHNVAAESARPASTLNLYRKMLAARQTVRPVVSGVPTWPAATGDVVVVHQPMSDGRTLVVACNTSDEPVTVPLPGSGDVLLDTSGAAELRPDGVHLPGATTVWLRCVNAE